MEPLRPAQLQAGQSSKPLHLIQNEPDRHDPAPKAVACYGLFRMDTQGMLLHMWTVVQGQCRDNPGSFWRGSRHGWRRQGKRRCCWCWDNTSWHVSPGAVRAWLKAHNRGVERAGGCRVVVCPLPIKSPSLNRIEPNGCMASEPLPDRMRRCGMNELKQRIYAYSTLRLSLDPIHKEIVVVLH